MRFQSRILKVSDLLLDSQNPRFIDLHGTDQSALIAYLLKNENIIDLARSISSYGGLMPGEFPIIFIENGLNIVVEGNRRICACKILLNPSLAPAEYIASIPIVTKPIKQSLNKVPVHIVNSREDAQLVLGMRHIQGIKTWPSIAKFMFFAKHYESGKSIEEIKLLTGVSHGTITKSLKKHYFLGYILSLDCWTEIEKQNVINYASLHRIGVDRILRIFNTEGSNELKLSYDENYFPVSELPDFGKIVEHVVRRVLNILPGKSEISTRNSFSDIKEDVREWLPKDVPKSGIIGSSNGKPIMNAIFTSSDLPAENKTIAGKSEITDTGTIKTPVVPPKTKIPHQTEFYLENLVYNLSQSNDSDRALISICEEIKRLSKGGGYRQYPLATSYLTRALIEQSCKRYLKINDNNAFNKLCNSGKDPYFSEIIKHFSNAQNLFADKQYQRLFTGLFPPNGAGMKNLMDLNMHHPGLSMPTGTILEGWVTAGLKNILEYLLK